MEVDQFLPKVIPASEQEMIVAELGLGPDWSAAYMTNSGQQGHRAASARPGGVSHLRLVNLVS